MARSDLSSGDEGTYVGAIGAGCCRLWFFVIDMIQGHPLRTPSVLGQVLLFGQRGPTSPTWFAAVIAYTAVHSRSSSRSASAWSPDSLAARESAVRYAILQVFLVSRSCSTAPVAGLSATRELFPLDRARREHLRGDNDGVLPVSAASGVRQLLRDVPLGQAPVK